MQRMVATVLAEITVRRAGLATHVAAGAPVERTRQSKALSLPPVVAGFSARIPQVQATVVALVWMLCEMTSSIIGTASDERSLRTPSEMVQDRARSGWTGRARDQHRIRDAWSVPYAFAGHRVLELLEEMPSSFRLAVVSCPVDAHTLMMHAKHSIDACLGKPIVTSRREPPPQTQAAAAAAAAAVAGLKEVSLRRTSS